MKPRALPSPASLYLPPSTLHPLRDAVGRRRVTVSTVLSGSPSFASSAVLYLMLPLVAAPVSLDFARLGGGVSIGKEHGGMGTVTIPVSAREAAAKTELESSACGSSAHRELPV